MSLDRNPKETIKTLVPAFLLPVVFAAAAFAVAGVYPFGGNTVLIVDMHNEYIDYLAQMNHTLHTSGSLLRSWSMGMGLNMLGLIAFYTASPFNLLVLLLPLSCITEAVFIVTLLKLGLAGCLFAVFAREIFPESGRIFHVICAVAYALCAYNIAYSSNIMWLDGAAFLPLVLLGVERILRSERYGLFLFGLVCVFFTSYYIGYMIGAFSFLYFTARYFASQNSLRAYVRRLARFLGSALLAACCCAFLLLPAFLNLKHGQSELWAVPFETRLRYPVIRLAAKLLPGAYDSLTDSGLPHIYCTVLAVSLCFLYFVTKAVPVREKLVMGGLLGALLLSFSCEILDLAWHAFEVPTWFPARYSFVFSFLILYFALKCVSVLNRISRREIVAASALLLLLTVEIAVNRFRFVSMRVFWIGIVLVLAYAAVLFCWNTRARRVLSAVLIIAACMESFFNASAMVRGMDKQFAYKTRDGYLSFMQSYTAAVERLTQRDAGVYRTEILGQRGANGAMALGYHGISHYSTTTDQGLNQFLRKLGYNTGTVNELRFAESTPLTNGILGIKYVISPAPLGGGYALRETVGTLGIYENQSAWPMAFWAPASAAGLAPDTWDNPFELQNAWVSALTGTHSRPFSALKAPRILLDNAKRFDDGDHITYERQVRHTKSSIGFEAANPAQQEVFAFLPVYNKRFSGSEVYVNGDFRGRDFMYRANTVLPLGNNASPELSVAMGGEILRVSAEYFTALDLKESERIAAKAAEHPVAFTTFRDTVVEGMVTAPADGLIATTFPYDKGWTVKIDGKRVEPVPLAGVFMAMPVPEGTHVLSMRYLPAGFAAGTAISIIAIAGIIVWMCAARRKKHAHKNALQL